MKVKIAKFAVAVVLLAALGIACYNAGKVSVYTEKATYFYKTEALLDSICSWDNSFMDTVMETDAYYEYEVAREKAYGY